MRTTLTIDDHIAQTLKEVAHRTGKSYKQVVNDTLRSGLMAQKVAGKAKPYQLKPQSLGKVLIGVDLTKSLQLADQLEDDEIARRLDMRK